MGIQVLYIYTAQYTYVYKLEQFVLFSGFFFSENK